MWKGVLCGLTMVSLITGAQAARAESNTTWVSHQPVAIARWTVSGTDTPVIFVPRHDVSMVDVAVVFQAGSARDGEQWGLANLTGSLIGTGTHRQEEQAILERFSRAGAVFDTSVSRDATIVHLRTMSAHRYYQKAVDTFEEVLTKARCDAGVTERLKKQIQLSLMADKDHTNTMAADALFRTLYGKHPYAHAVKGTPQTLAPLTAQDAQAFYTAHMVQKQASVVIVGDLSLRAAHRLARSLIRPLPVGDTLSPLPLALAPARAAYRYVPMHKSQDAIVIGQLGFLPYDAHYYGRLVGNDLFGRAPLTSMLFKEVRDKRGLAYHAGSQLAALQAGGPFLMMAQSRLSAAKQTSQVMRHTFSRFVEGGVSAKRVAETKRSLTGQFPLMYASNASIMTQLVSMAVHHYPLTFFADYAKHIDAVTVNAVKQAFAPLHSQRWVEVVAGGRDIMAQRKGASHG